MRTADESGGGSSSLGSVFGDILKRVNQSSAATIMSRPTSTPRFGISSDWVQSALDRAEELKRQRDEMLKRQAEEAAAQRKQQEEERAQRDKEAAAAQAERDAAASAFRQRDSEVPLSVTLGRLIDPTKANYPGEPDKKGLIQRFTESAARKVVPGNTFLDDLAANLAGGTIHDIGEVPASALDQGLGFAVEKGARAVGQDDFARGVERWRKGIDALAGTRFAEKSKGENAAQALSSTGQILSFAAGGAVGKAAERAAVPLAERTLVRLGLKGLSEGATGKAIGFGAKVAASSVTNVAIDTPVTAAQLAAVGINPFSSQGRELLKQQATMSAITGAAFPVTGALAGKANEGLARLPQPALELGKTAATAGAAYGVTRGLTGDEDAARAAAVAAASLRLSPTLYNALENGVIPAWVTRPLRNLGGSVIEEVDDQGNKINRFSKVSEWDAGSLKKPVVSVIGDAAFVTMPGRAEAVRVGYRGENTNKLLARARAYWKALDETPVEQQAAVAASLRQQFLTGEAPAGAPRLAPEPALPVTQLTEMDLQAAQPGIARQVLEENLGTGVPRMSDVPDELQPAVRRSGLPYTEPGNPPSPEPGRTLDLSQRVQSENPVQPTATMQNTSIKDRLLQLAWGPVDPENAPYYAQLEKERNRILALNKERLATFQKPLPVPDGDPTLRAREVLNGTYGEPYALPPDVTERQLFDAISEQATNNPTEALRQQLASEPGGEARQTPRPEDFGLIPLSEAPKGTVVYHGTAQPIEGPLRPDSWVTPNRADAETFARVSAKVTGGEPRVYTFEANDTALRPGEPGLTATRGSMQVSDPTGLKQVGEPEPVSTNYGKSPDGTKFTVLAPEDAPPPPETVRDKIERRAAPNAKQLAADPAAKTFADEADDYIRNAEAQTSSRRLTSKATPGVARVADPGSRFKLPSERSAHAVVTAAANYARSSLDSSYERMRILAPLVGDTAMRTGAKAVAELTPAATAIGLAYLPDGEIAGWKDELLIASGFGTMAIISEQYAKGFAASRPWMKATLAEGVERSATHEGTTRVLTEAENKAIEKSPALKLMDIIEHPDDYVLTDKQRAALQQYQTLRDQWLEETNASLRASGQPQIPKNEANRVFHAFDEESFKRQFGDSKIANPLIEIVTPGKLRRMPLEQERQMGATWRDIIAKYPELRPPKDIAAVFAEEARQHSQVRARSVLLKGLQDKGVGRFLPDPDSLPKGAERDAALELQSDMRKKGWVTVPGMGNTYVDPNAAKVIGDLLRPVRDGNAVVNSIDILTNEIRTAMFSLDLSAWTLQGAMLAVNRPITFLTHIHDLILASSSEKYFRWWQNRNGALVRDAAKSGVNLGREFAGRELEGRFNPAKRPFIGHLENAGFGRMLPVMRAISYKSQRDTEAFLQGIKGGRLPVVGDAARLVEVLPAAAYAGYQLKEGDDIDPATASILLLAGAGVGVMRDYVGSKLWNSLDETGKAQAAARAGKITNRTGSVLNREQLGMGTEQSKLERVLLFRSPAMTRNAITMVGLALNPGAEGQAARAYLVRSALMYTALLGAAKYALTGKMDTFNPNDEDSILNVANLGKVQVPGMGSFSPSNPLISITRYALYQDRPDDQQGYDWTRWDPRGGAFWHDKAHGLERFVTGRTTDLVGQVLNPAISSATDQAVGSDYRDVYNDQGAKQANLGGVVAGLAKKFTPLTLQQAADSGLLQKTEIGGTISDKLGIESNPNFNTTREGVINAGMAALGFNAQPESLATELVRRRDAVVAQKFPNTDYYDLNQRDREQVNSILDEDQQYQELKSALDQRGMKPSPVDTYFAEQKNINDSYAKTLKDYQKAVDRGQMTRSDFREKYQEAQRSRQTELDRLEARYQDISAERPGTDESVVAYLGRHTQPEDTAVENYFKLFDKANTPAGLDFDKLEQLQDQYKASLDRRTRNYLEERLASYDKPSTNSLVNEYKDVKKELAPYWTIRDQVFAKAQQDMPFFSQFKTEKEFQSAVADLGKQYGLTADDMLNFLSSKNRQIKVYTETVSRYQKQYLAEHPLADIALVDWYDHAPVDRLRYAAAQVGMTVPAQHTVGVVKGDIPNSVSKNINQLRAISENGTPIKGSVFEYWKRLFYQQ